MADSKISDLAAVGTLASADEFAIADNDISASRKANASQIATFVGANLTLGANMTVDGFQIVSTSSTDIELHSDNDVNVILGDAAGVDDFNVKDSANVTVASINSDGALTAVSYGGVLEANLLDKSAAESISATWSFVDITMTGNLTGATIDADLNTITNIEDADIKAGAAIQESKLAIDFISGATYTNTQDLHRVSDSNGVITGGQITDGGSGTVDIAAGSCLIRSTDSALGDLRSTDFAAVTGQALTNLSINFIYVDYNAGSPVVAVQTTPLADPHTKVVLGSAYRSGTDVHISNISVPTAQSTQLTSLRLGAVEGLTRQAGAIISETGTRNFAATAGTWWTGLVQTTTTAFDSSGTDTFNAYYQDGLGDFVTVTGQTQIDNTQYDDGTGTLNTLGPAKYGVHWLYTEVDSDWAVVYGRGSYTLSAAQAATPPANIPGQLFPLHAALAGKIIIQLNDTAFTSIQTAFETSFGLGVAQDHGDLAGLADDDHTQYFNQTRLGDGTVTGLAVTGAITATSYGGITEANLLDKSAAETVSGTWTFSSGILNVGTGGTDGKLVLNGPSVNDFVFYASSSIAGVIDSAVDVWINIDTNNNQTTERFVVGQDAEGTASSRMFQILEGPTDGTDSEATFYGNVTVNGTLDSGTLGVTGNITVTGTVDGRDVATDGTALDTHVALVNEHIDWTSTSSNFSTTGTISMGNILGDRINIYSTTYKLGIAASTLFYDVPTSAHHEWRVNGVEVARSDVTAFNVTGNITLTGTVDGVDIAAFKSAYDTHVPTTITVANEATDTTCFVPFFTAATGDLGPKTNANFTYDSSATTLTVGFMSLAGNGEIAGIGRDLNLSSTTDSVVVLNSDQATGDEVGAFWTSGGIAAGKNIWSQGRTSASPHRYLRGGTATLGSTNASLDLTSIPAFDCYEVHVNAKLITNTARILRVRFNGDTGTTSHGTYYNTFNGTTNTLSRTVRGIGLWQNNQTEGSAYFVFRVSGRVDAIGQFFTLSKGFLPPFGTSSGDVYKGGYWSEANTTQISQMTFEIFSTTTTNTVVTGTDDMELGVEIYGSFVGTNSWTA